MSAKNKYISFKNFKLVKIATIQDNSRFLHAFIQAFDRGYLSMVMNDKKELIKNLRLELSNKILEKIDSSNIIYYDYLFNGKIKQLARSNNNYEKTIYINNLKNDYNFVNEYNELISEIFSKDIYLIDLDNNELFVDKTVAKLTIKERDSVVIGFSDGEYYTLGLIEPDKNIITHFSAYNSFITSIRETIIPPYVEEKKIDEKKVEG